LLPRPAPAEPRRVRPDRELAEPPRFAHSRFRRICARLVPKRRDPRIGLGHNQKLVRRVEEYQLLGMSVIGIRLRSANDGPERRTSLKRSKKKKKKKKKKQKKKKKKRAAPMEHFFVQKKKEEKNCATRASTLKENC
jgi:DNA primase